MKPIHALAWVKLALLFLIVLSTPQRGWGFSPPGEPVIGQIKPSVTGQSNPNGYSVLLTGQNNATGAFTYTIKRPSFTSVTKTFSPLTSSVISTFFVKAAIIGDHGMLFVTDEEDANHLHTATAVLMDAAQAAAPVRPLYQVVQGDTLFTPPAHQLAQNTDGSCLFAYTRSFGTISDKIAGIGMWRTDHFDSSTPALCSLSDQDIGSLVEVFAQIVPLNVSAGETTDARILLDATIASDCPLPLPALVVNGGTCLDFGSTTVNTTVSKPVSFCNPGLDSITVTSLSANGPFSGPQNFQALTIAPGHCQTLNMTFAPTVAGPTGNLQLQIGRDTTLGQSTLCCTGNATNPAPNLVVVPQPLNFGNVINNTTASATVTFGNQGTASVAITAIGKSTHFSAPGFGGLPPLGPGQQSSPVQISFNPNGDLGIFNESLSLTLNTASFGATRINCSANSVLPTVTITALTNCIPESAVNGVKAFRVSRNGATGSSLTVNVSRGGTAISDPPLIPLLCGKPDYKDLGKTVVIAQSSSFTDVILTPIADSFAGRTNTVILSVASGTGYTAGTPASATVCISDSDPVPVVTVLGKTASSFTSTGLVAGISLSAPSKVPVTVNWTTFTGTIVNQCFIDFFTKLSTCSFLTNTATPGSPCCFICNPSSDFTMTSGQVVIPPCTVTQTVTVPICNGFIQTNKTFFIGLSAPVNAVLGSHDVLQAGVGVCTIQQGVPDVTSPCNTCTIGFFDLEPAYGATAKVHEPVNYAYTWTVPDPLNWHALEWLKFRLRDDEENLLTVRLDVASKTLSVLNEANGQFVAGGLPGSPWQLETPEATLYLSHSSAVGSGPTGPSVTLNLALSFKPSAANRFLSVEVAARDLLGGENGFAQAGTLFIEPIH
ncbi:MAG: hypothetical protein C5B50_16270 [Verrucomicrobia bacterium]|nr:MAG: hypothetical protein C5B50_16270 [Verrucomicrobiota bacterium]